MKLKHYRKSKNLYAHRPRFLPDSFFNAILVDTCLEDDIYQRDSKIKDVIWSDMVKCWLKMVHFWHSYACYMGPLCRTY